MKYFFVAGEKSGDLHTSALAKEIVARDAEAIMEGWGGDDMAQIGVKIHHHYRDLDFMGLDFLSSFGNLYKLYKLCKEQILAMNPDVLVLVDYSGFNLRIAKWARRKNFKVVYYIAPKTWAWNSLRNRTIRRTVDKLLVILPFEKKYFSERGINTTYVGNPLLERINAFVPDMFFKEKLPTEYKYTVALLPGSRKKEVERVYMELKKVARNFSDTLFVVAAIGDLDHFYDGFQCIQNCMVITDSTYDLLAIADAAVVTSGTATLETALFNVPQVVVYKTSNLTYEIAKRLINVKFISLVNLLLNREAVPELIQEDFQSADIKARLKEIIEDGKFRNKQLESYKEIRQLLGSKNASEHAAIEIIKMFQE